MEFTECYHAPQRINPSNYGHLPALRFFAPLGKNIKFADKISSYIHAPVNLSPYNFLMKIFTFST